jgi:hypothetical protein
MTIRTLGTLLLKLWGLTWLAGGLIGLMNVGVLLSAWPRAIEPATQYHIATAANAIVSIVLGTILLLGARPIVAVLDRDGDAEAPALSGQYSLAELQSVAFGGVGAFLAISALRNIAVLVYAIVQRPAWDSAGTGQVAFLLASQQKELIGAAVQLVFAVVLLFSRSALATGWSRLRTNG